MVDLSNRNPFMQHVNKYHAGAIHFMEEDNALISCLLMNHVAVYCLGWGKCAFFNEYSPSGYG